MILLITDRDRLDGPRAGPAPRTFISAMQTMKRKEHGMSDRFEDGCQCGAVRFVATGQPAISGSVTKTG